MRSFFFLFIFCFGLQGFAALNANFTATSQQGCAPIVVTFTDISTGGNIIYRAWNFGNGNTAIGNNSTPTATYTNAGFYSVTLTISDGTDTATITQTNFIEVYPNPEVNFNFSSPLGCIPHNVQFTNLSNTVSSGGNNFLWDFGDGSPPANQENPLHQYTTAGTFTVSLTLTDSNGCSATKDSVSIITTQAKPTASFTTSQPTVSCATPLTVNFTNTSVGNNLSFLWQFGAAGSSTQPNPSITFNQNGQYSVSLVVTNAAGCSDTVNSPNLVSIAPTVAQFNLNDTLCLHQPYPIQNTSVGASQFLWSFGNNTTSTQQNPTVTYTQPGTFTIQLQASSPPNCVANFSKTVFVEEVFANFGVDTGFACSVPFNVQYIDSSSSNVVSWEWKFDDFDVLTNPQFAYTKNPQRAIFTDMLSKDTLTVTTASGCKATKALSAYVRVDVPDAAFNINQLSGCAPLDILVENNSASFDSIVSYEYKFGTLATSNSPIDSFVFTSPGTYDVCLKITTQRGCVDSTCVAVNVGEKPSVNFWQEKDSVCAGGMVQFNDLSTDSNKITERRWQFSDATPTKTSKKFQHIFEDIGWIGLQLVVSIDGCKDTLEQDSVVFVSGPISEIFSDFSCNQPFNYTFYDSTQMSQRFKWDFGDSLGYDSLSQSPNYTYQNTGNYTVSFTAYNDSTGCTFTDNITVRVRNLQASFQISDSLICRNQSVTFDASSSIDAANFGYKWLFGNGNSFSFTPNPPSQSYGSTGIKYARLIVEDVNGCFDTLQKQIKVFQPQAKFNLGQTSGCAPFLLNLTDSSVFDTTAHQIRWTIEPTNDTLYGNSSYSFNTTQNATSSGNLLTDSFRVNLWVKDTLGCTASVSDSVVIYRYNTAIRPSDTALCVMQNFSIFDSLNLSGVNYTWFFGNGDSASGNPVNYAFHQAGNYLGYLKIKEINSNCTNTDTFQFKLRVQQATTPGFTANITDTSCFPATIIFTDTTTNVGNIKRFWRFRDGISPVQVAGNSASFTYNNPGKFSVVLITETAFGCRDSIKYNQFININGPAANWVIEPDTACINDTLSFKMLDAVNVNQAFIDFGDGFDTTLFADTMAFHAYNQVGFIQPVVIISDSLNTCRKTQILSLFIHQVKAGLRFLTDSSGCAPYSGKLVSVAQGQSNESYLLNNNLFNFPTDSSIQIITAGNYSLQQKVIDVQTGCTDSVIKQIVVYPNPTIPGLQDTVLCEGDSVQVNLPKGVNYTWKPNIYLKTDTGSTNIYFGEANVVYKINAQNEWGCIDSVLQRIEILPRYNLLAFGDTSIYQGEEALLGLNTNLNNPIINWSPAMSLFCANCKATRAAPLNNTIFYVSVTDSLGCFFLTDSVNVEVIEAFSASLPNTFSPNGDGVNDVIYAKGWGIAEILEFKIFNRWGEIVFETFDVNQGWDGTYKGEPQEMDTYVYLLRVKSYNNQEKAVKGTINLVR